MATASGLQRGHGTASLLVALAMSGCRCDSLSERPDPIPCLRRALDLAQRDNEDRGVAAADELVSATELTLQAVDVARERGCADPLELQRARLAHTIAVFDRERISAQPPDAGLPGLVSRAHVALRLAVLLEDAQREHARGELSVGQLLAVQHTTIETIWSLLKLK